MASKNDNHNTYMPGHTKVAHHEWRTAENSAAYLLPTLQSKAQSNPKLTLLDIGCGSGTITATLAKYMPEGHITAVDISSDILDTAGKYAEKHGVKDRITFQTADIYALPYEDNTFDIVHASQVLAHLDSPVQAYKEMLRVTRPDGGVVANRESDISMWSYYPDLPGLKKYHEIMLEVMKGSGGNPQAGPRLISWAMQAGAPRSNITATMGTWMYSSREEREMWGECCLTSSHGPTVRLT